MEYKISYHLILKKTILKVVDIMCGMFGVVNYRLNEVKTPCDMRCVEAVFHRGPDEVLYRKKNPYSKTHNPHYTSIVQALLREGLKDRDSILHEMFDERKLWSLANSDDVIMTRL